MLSAARLPSTRRELMSVARHCNDWYLIATDFPTLQYSIVSSFYLFLFNMVTKNLPPTSDDELDDILNGIAAEGGYVESQPEHSKNKATSNNTDAALGIDEEIVVTKKRIPIPKLDDVRLRSEPGIPRLRKISKERLRFKGKGHEVKLPCIFCVIRRLM